MGNRKRIKPRGTVQRHGYRLGFAHFAEIEDIQIAAWSPDPEGKVPSTQVHFVQRLEKIDTPLVLRFKSPDTLGFLIEELIEYRRIVWPDCDKVSGEVDDDDSDDLPTKSAGMQTPIR